MIYKVKNLFNIVYCTFKEIFDINLYKTQESTAIAGQILKNQDTLNLYQGIITEHF